MCRESDAGGSLPVLSQRVRAAAPPCRRSRIAENVRAGRRWACWISVADVVGQDEEVFRRVEQLSWTEKDSCEDRPQEAAAGASGPVKDQNGVRRPAICVLHWFAERPIVDPRFRQRLAGLKMKIAYDEVTFLRRRPSLRGLIRLSAWLLRPRRHPVLLRSGRCLHDMRPALLLVVDRHHTKPSAPLDRDHPRTSGGGRLCPASGTRMWTTMPRPMEDVPRTPGRCRRIVEDLSERTQPKYRIHERGRRPGWPTSPTTRSSGSNSIRPDSWRITAVNSITCRPPFPGNRTTSQRSAPPPSRRSHQVKQEPGCTRDRVTPIDRRASQMDSGRTQDVATRAQSHDRAFTTNAADPLYRQLSPLRYRDGDENREMAIPTGDVLHQFRKDVETGRLPAVSWGWSRPKNFSDPPVVSLVRRMVMLPKLWTFSPAIRKCGRRPSLC